MRTARERHRSKEKCAATKTRARFRPVTCGRRRSSQSDQSYACLDASGSGTASISAADWLPVPGQSVAVRGTHARGRGRTP